MVYAVLPLEDLSFFWLDLALRILLALILLSLIAALLLIPGTRERLKGCLRFALEHPWATLLTIVVIGAATQTMLGSKRGESNRRPKGSNKADARTDAVEPLVAGAPWPCDRGSLERTARVGDSPGPRGEPPQRRWRIGRPGEAFYGSPAVVGNRVYAVGSEGEASRVAAVDVASGKLAWSGGPPGLRATFSSPTIVGDTLICGEGLHSTRQARVFALDLRSGREGSVRWSFRTEGHVECSPQWSEGAIFFNAGDDGTYALDPPARPGDSVAVRYHGGGGRFIDAETALLVAEGRTYVGLGVDGNALCALDARTGKELGRATTGEPVFALPALDGDSLFIGCGGGDYANPENAKTGAVMRLHRESLDVIWRRDVPGTVLGAVIVVGDRVVFGCGDGRVYVVSRDNQTLASWDTGAAIAAPLAVADSWIYGVNRAGTLFAIDMAKGELAWRVTIGVEGHFVSGPVVVGSSLILGTPHDGLVCLAP